MATVTNYNNNGIIAISTAQLPYDLFLTDAKYLLIMYFLTSVEKG